MVHHPILHLFTSRW